MHNRDIPWLLAPARGVGGTAGGKIATVDSTGRLTTLVLNMAAGSPPRKIIFTSTVPCLVLCSTAAATAVATNKFDFYVPGNVPVGLELLPGTTKLDVIAEPTSGSGSAYYQTVEYGV
jgi:hypothetical protein